MRPLLAILALPVNATLTVPAILVWARGGLPFFGLGPPWGALALAASFILFGTGLSLLVSTVRLFWVRGHGTLAPWDPPRKLVFEGPYRYVRNPMISGVMMVLWGESLALGSTAMLWWAAIFTLANALFIPLFEEPHLRKRYGEEYVQYCRHVPRWLPRVTPWIDSDSY